MIGAIDIGGTTIKSALVGSDLTVGTEYRVPTPRAEGPDAVVEAVREVAVRLGGVDALGVASLGLVDEAAGRAVYSAAIGWRDVPLAALLTQAVGVPVFLGHDIRAAARAEAECVPGESVDSMLFLAIGTGIGAAMRVSGREVAGANYRAGEIGHAPARPGGRLCGCGAHGCLEAYSSAAAIARDGSAAAGREVSARDVAQAAERGRSWAVEVWRSALAVLADAIVSACVLADPEVIVIGGGLSLAGDGLLVPLTELLAARYPFADPPPVRLAGLGDRAALLGAALLARDAGIS